MNYAAGPGVEIGYGFTQSVRVFFSSSISPGIEWGKGLPFPVEADQRGQHGGERYGLRVSGAVNYLGKASFYVSKDLRRILLGLGPLVGNRFVLFLLYCPPV